MRLLIVTLLFGQSLIAQNSLLWKVISPSKQDTSYLFGSIHLRVDTVFFANSRWVDLVDSVEAVYGELNLYDGNFEELNHLIYAGSIDSSAANVLDSLSLNKLDSMLKLNCDPSLVDLKNVLKPMAYLTQVMQCMLPQTAGTSMDEWVQQHARLRQIRVGGLEEASDQVMLLYGAPFDLQEKTLIEFADSFDKNVEDTKLLLKLYLQQDLKSLDSLTRSTNDTTWLSNEILIDQRNQVMLQGMLKQIPICKTMFVVGAAHLPGQKGLLALLKNEGYELIPMP